MDPTVVLPLHFTIEAVVLTAAALVLAWAALRRQWVAAGAALALTVAQALHAGYYADEGDVAVVVLRLVGVAGLAFVLSMDELRRVFAGGLAAIAIGTIWGAAEGGGAGDFSVLPHVFLVGGGIALLVWVSYATRPSVRLRVIVAFVSVLAVAVVVAGGAIARVAALDSRQEQYTRLGILAVGAERTVGVLGDALSRRAAAYSPALSTEIQRGRASLDPHQLRRFEWAVLFARDGAQIDRETGADGAVPYTRADLFDLDVVVQARNGEVDVPFATAVSDEGLIVLTAAAILRPTAAARPSDVVGVVVLGRTLSGSEAGLDSIVPDPAVEVVVIGERHSVSSDPRLPAGGFARPTVADPFRTIEVPSGTWFATARQMPQGNVVAVFATPDSVVADAATELVQAFLIAVLAAALLAVVGALWLSSRITRPLLALADDAERVKSDFLSSVSHELRTPLTPIRGYTELLRRGVPARSRTGYLDEIGNATQRLERIVSLLVDVAAMDAGRYQIAEEDVSVQDLFAAAKDHWTDRKKPARIEARLPKGELGVRADPTAISRVLDELIDNAIKFDPEGVVELRGRRVRDRVELSVSDRGPGIDAERLAALRTPFETGERGGDTKRYGGLGLGLSFVEGVLRAHGTQLSIATEPGQGTTCVFTLPAAGSVTAMPARTGPAARKAASRKR